MKLLNCVFFSCVFAFVAACERPPGSMQPDDAANTNESPPDDGDEDAPDDNGAANDNADDSDDDMNPPDPNGDDGDDGDDDSGMDGTTASFQLRGPVFSDEGREIKVDRKEKRWLNGSLRMRKEYFRTSDDQLVKHGLLERSNEDGKLIERWNFKYNLPEGLMEHWHPNGQLKVSAEWKDGKLHGTWTSWDDRGNVLRKARYENGVEVTP